MVGYIQELLRNPEFPLGGEYRAEARPWEERCKSRRVLLAGGHSNSTLGQCVSRSASRL